MAATTSFDAANIGHSIATRGVEFVLAYEAESGSPHSWTFCLLATLISGAGGGLLLEVAGAW